MIHKKLSGQMTESEENHFDLWLRSNVNHQNIFNQYKNIWKEATPKKFKFDSDQAYLRMQARLQKDTEVKVLTPKSSFNYYTLYKIAAVAILVIAVLFVVDSIQKPTFSTGDISRTYTLEDGSEVWLGPQSSLIIEKISPSNRQVTLKGSAVFDVAKNPNAPFTVHAGNLNVNVVGTSFTVNSLENQVFVREGVVKVEFNEQVVTLMEDQSASLSSNGTITSDNTAYTSPSWLNLSLTYDNQPLEKVLFELELAYNIDFNINDEVRISECRFTSSSLKSDSIDQIINTLKATFDMKVEEVTENHYQISGLNCH